MRSSSEPAVIRGATSAWRSRSAAGSTVETSACTVTRHSRREAFSGDKVKLAVDVSAVRAASARAASRFLAQTAGPQVAIAA